MPKSTTISPTSNLVYKSKRQVFTLFQVSLTPTGFSFLRWALYISHLQKSHNLYRVRSLIFHSFPFGGTMWNLGEQPSIISATHNLCCVTHSSLRITLGTFKKYVCSRFPIFDPPFPFVHPCSFSSTPPLPIPKVCSFWLELTLSPSISVVMKFREKKLIMSTSIFGWT